MKPRVYCRLRGLVLLDDKGHAVAMVDRLSDHPKLGPPRCESSTRTSILVNVDFVRKEIETLNTIYYW